MDEITYLIRERSTAQAIAEYQETLSLLDSPLSPKEHKLLHEELIEQEAAIFSNRGAPSLATRHLL